MRSLLLRLRTPLKVLAEGGPLLFSLLGCAAALYGAISKSDHMVLVGILLTVLAASHQAAASSVATRDLLESLVPPLHRVQVRLIEGEMHVLVNGRTLDVIQPFDFEKVPQYLLDLAQALNSSIYCHDEETSELLHRLAEKTNVPLIDGTEFSRVA